MAAGNEDISLVSFTARFLRKLAEPKALSALHTALRVDRDAAISIGLLLERRAAEMPDRVAIKFRDQTWTWAQYNAWANRYAHYFASRGIGKGDVIALDMSNRPEVLVAVCAAAKLGAIAAMINTSQSGDVLAHALELVKPKLLLAAPAEIAQLDTVPQALAGARRARLLFVGDEPGEKVPDGYTALHEASVGFPQGNPETTARVTLRDSSFLIFTSGTTGLPKASIMSHYRWYRSALSMGRLVLNLSADDTFYCCLPLYHNNALTLAMGAAMTTGAALALSPRFSASRFWDEVRHYQATCFAYIGEILRYLLNQPPRADDREHKVRAIMGNGLRPEVWDAFKARYGIARVHEFYASSEGNNGFLNLLNYDKTCGFCPSGWAIVAYDVDADEPVRRPNGRMKKLGRGETGLLMTEVSEKMPFDGYTSKEANERKLFRDVFRKGDCWFNTGDLMRAQGYGHAQFVDRIGDTFRWQGENVATTQVEAVANRWPQIDDGVVYGVKLNGRDGRCGMLSCSLRQGETLDAAGLAAHLQAALPAYAVPRFLRLRAAQDLTGTFKHQKAGLKREGYEPAQIADPLYVLPPGSGRWLPLTAALKQDIDSGKLRL